MRMQFPRVLARTGLVVAVAVALIAGCSPSGDKTKNKGSTPMSSIEGRFIPPTTVEHGVVTMPVTLPNGDAFIFKYPEQTKIAQSGFAGSAGVNWIAKPNPTRCCSKQVRITYQTIADVYGDATPVHVYRGRNFTSVPYFHASQALKTVVPELDFLVFQVGPWLVQVDDVPATNSSEPRMTEAQREAWARSLTGTIDANGYLELHVFEPLSLSSGFEGAFGDGSANTVELAEHTACGQSESDTSVRRRFADEGGSGVAWCAGDLHVAATGTPEFVGDAATDLQARASIATTPPPAAAVSADFGSQHGWMLERNGDVYGTRDGGTNWAKLGSVGPLPEDNNVTYVGHRIRFADTTRGFIHTEDELFMTDDGGRHWQKVDTPFRLIYDLAVSNGKVFVVSRDGTTFTLWSTQTDDLDWSMDEHRLEVGTQNQPMVQLAVSGAGGWVISTNVASTSAPSLPRRASISGARLDASGRWKAWKPPCRNPAGYARPAASSARDLVVGCFENTLENTRGNGFETAVYFSRDGGDTFAERQTASSAAVVSVSANTAVIVELESIAQTTDGGASWSLVGSGSSGIDEGAIDLGFTSSTQGFVVFDDGTMFMTYDAGATWSAVTQP
jgi:photosystem II stability/assembly factor-like uncharacterized protein